MRNTDKALIITNGYRGAGGAGLLRAPAARRRAGPRSGMVTASASPGPDRAASGRQEGGRHRELARRDRSAATAGERFEAALWERTGAPRGREPAPPRDRDRPSCGEGPGPPSQAAPPVHAVSRGLAGRREPGTDRAGERQRDAGRQRPEKRPGRPREAPSPGHSPARRARPAPRGLPSSPIRALRGGRILITTKYPSRDPPAPPSVHPLHTPRQR